MDYVMEQDGSLYYLIETKTDTIVLVSNDPGWIKNKQRNLNFGSGFAGFTPSFFHNRLEIKPDQA